MTKSFKSLFFGISFFIGSTQLLQGMDNTPNEKIDNPSVEKQLTEKFNTYFKAYRQTSNHIKEYCSDDLGHSCFSPEIKQEQVVFFTKMLVNLRETFIKKITALKVDLNKEFFYFVMVKLCLFWRLEILKNNSTSTTNEAALRYLFSSKKFLQAISFDDITFLLFKYDENTGIWLFELANIIPESSGFKKIKDQLSRFMAEKTYSNVSIKKANQFQKYPKNADKQRDAKSKFSYNSSKIWADKRCYDDRWA